ncbi:MAG: type II secretion system protein [Clostridiales bacterium]|nr:type II secretion system protein [Clostridiales bacterium]
MKKTVKTSKKGFTLVELIVVLVILAVLAAMLVPALVGYVDKAKKEKEYQTAATVYGAAQATITEMYGRNKISKGSTLSLGTSTWGPQVIKLAGVDSKAVTAFSFTYGDNFIISGGTVTISNHVYTLTIDTANGAPSWSGET